MYPSQAISHEAFVAPLSKRDLIYHEIGEYLEKISSVSKKSTAEEKAIRAKILQIKATTENAVENKAL